MLIIPPHSHQHLLPRPFSFSVVLPLLTLLSVAPSMLPSPHAAEHRQLHFPGSHLGRVQDFAPWGSSASEAALLNHHHGLCDSTSLLQQKVTLLSTDCFLRWVKQTSNIQMD